MISKYRSLLAKNGQKWSKMVETGPNWQNRQNLKKCTNRQIGRQNGLKID